MRPCLLIPIYNHGDTIRQVVAGLDGYGLPCLIVDDGSDAGTRAVLDSLAGEFPQVRIERLPDNRGRGAALRHGYRVAAARGFTHAVQVDADGQHDPGDVPAFLAAARHRPGALILGAPRFDKTAPRSRRYGRLLSSVWVWVETLSLEVADPLCGFRCIPLGPAVVLLTRTPLGNHMEFDPELVVRLVWAGVPVVNVPTHVRYYRDGLSHFHPLLDNARISWAHTRLVFGMVGRLHRRRWRYRLAR
jgi:glycosyltransferase involved in cell wall biosynthesis